MFSSFPIHSFEAAIVAGASRREAEQGVRGRIALALFVIGVCATMAFLATLATGSDFMIAKCLRICAGVFLIGAALLSWSQGAAAAPEAQTIVAPVPADAARGRATVASETARAIKAGRPAAVWNNVRVLHSQRRDDA